MTIVIMVRAKHIKPVVILFFLCFLSSVSLANWSESELIQANTAHSAPLSVQEKQVFLYVNLARLFPQKFCQYEYQKYLGAKYHQEGSMTSYQRSLKQTLLSAASQVAYTYNSSMQSSAACFASEQSRTGGVGHNRQTCAKNHAAECCSYGPSDAIGIVFLLLIDQDVTSLGHRKILLSDSYYSMGVSIATHPRYGNCCVLDISWDEGKNMANGQLPILNTSNKTISTTSDLKSETEKTEINHSGNQINELKAELSIQKQTISSLTAQNSQLRTENTLLGSQLAEERDQLQQVRLENQQLKNQQILLQQSNQQLKSENELLASKRTTVRKSQYNQDEFHSFSLKMGLGISLPYQFNLESLQSIRANQTSPQAQLVLLKNFGDSYKRNSVGIQSTIGQWNMTVMTDSTFSYATTGAQFLDLQALIVCREWLQFGLGAQGSKHIGASIFTVINPIASVGLNFGPRRFKISLQSSVTYFEKSVLPTANLSFQIQL